MTIEELNFIKDAFSQIIDDIAGNPDWGDAARAVASDLGTLERKLEKRVTELPSNFDEAADTFAHNGDANGVGGDDYEDDLRITFKAGAEWMAGQGYTTEETVYFERLCDETRIMVDFGPTGERGGFQPGDKVIVQIRKK